MLIDSRTARRFVRVGIGDDPPNKSTLHENVSKLHPETWQEIFELTVGIAKEMGVDGSDKTRGDHTVVETNIHAPSDSSLLLDVVRVLARDLDTRHGSVRPHPTIAP